PHSAGGAPARSGRPVGCLRSGPFTKVRPWRRLGHPRVLVSSPHFRHSVSRDAEETESDNRTAERRGAWRRRDCINAGGNFRVGEDRRPDSYLAVGPSPRPRARGGNAARPEVQRPEGGFLQLPPAAAQRRSAPPLSEVWRSWGR